MSDTPSRSPGAGWQQYPEDGHLGTCFELPTERLAQEWAGLVLLWGASFHLAIDLSCQGRCVYAKLGLAGRRATVRELEAAASLGLIYAQFARSLELHLSEVEEELEREERQTGQPLNLPSPEEA
ncbi:MAG TPA: hypothetical protein PK413_18220 [Thermoanaerobaculia bacterium]|nr:hypothetical protein [Thermoanaerobaculia bacterium]